MVECIVVCRLDVAGWESGVLCIREYAVRQNIVTTDRSVLLSRKWNVKERHESLVPRSCP